MFPDRALWKEWQSRYKKWPMIGRFQNGNIRLPLSWERMQQQAGDRYLIMESGKVGRYTYVIKKPDEWLTVKNGKVTMSAAQEREWHTGTSSPAPFDMIRKWLEADEVPPRPQGFPPFLGGVAGWVSYDVSRSLERLPALSDDDLNLPDLIFYRTDRVWIWDHQEEVLYCAIHWDECKNFENNMYNTAQKDDTYSIVSESLTQMAEEWITWCNLDPQQRIKAEQRHEAVRRWSGQPEWDIHVDDWDHLRRSLSGEQFCAAVGRIHEWIRAGDVFQVNLSVRQSCTLTVAPEEVYEWLRAWNPSPYMALFSAPDHQLVSGSPELLVKTRGRHVFTRPIAGTRPRGQTLEEDEAYEAQLLATEKEIAEHIMLVDLERNDIGRVCRYGSVHVSELLTIERYSHVMHLVSQVEGQLADAYDTIDLLKAVFPGGAITGAPKIRTMEIIETLEPVRRGPYTGSLGWIDYGGDLEMNILIRTMVCKDGNAHIQAGAGIVIDSLPEKEYQESLNKAKALWKALVSAERAARNQQVEEVNQ